MSFKTHVKTVLLDPKREIEIDAQERLDIILSPRLYWVHRFLIPVSSVKEAKKLLPSLFEEFLPEGEYRYEAYFDGDDVIAFAYEHKKILELLHDKQIELSRIRSVRFAQNEIGSSLTPCLLDEEHVMVEQDGLLIVVPKSFANEYKELSLKELPLSPKPIDFERYSNIVDTRTLYVVVLLLFAFVVLNLVELGVTYKKTTNLEESRREVFLKNGLLPTSMQNLSLLKKYEKIDKRQKKLRKVIATLMRVHLPKGSTLESLSYGKEKIILSFSGVTKKEAILKAFKEFTLVDAQLQKRRLRMELAI